MSEANIVLPPLMQTEWTILWVVLGSAFVALGYGALMVWSVLKCDPGTPAMQRVGQAIEDGAMAYLRRQIKVMVGFVLVLGIGLYFMYSHLYRGQAGFSRFLPMGVALAFLAGVMASYGAGYVGMWLAVKANVRTAAAAMDSFPKAMKVAFNAGTVSGMFTVGFGLLGATLIFLVFREQAMRVLVGFGFGGSLAALFMRVGGGIYTKAADIGADLVGKIEAGIPEDDPRNAAVIADNVGDNVGDCAGMAADVFESYEVTLVAAIILAAATLTTPQFMADYGAGASAFALKLILFPLMIRAVGVFASIAGTMSVRLKPGEQDPMKPITWGYMVSSVVALIGVALVNAWYLKDPRTGAVDWRFTVASGIGIILAILTLWLTNYYTHPNNRPVSETAIASKTGPATLLLSGMAEGNESTVWAIVLIGATILSSMWVFHGEPALAPYGIALAGLGLLTTTGYILAMDTYGPITDNAHGVFEMAEVKNERASRSLSWMDAIGNTTKALTKGLAIATAVLAAVSLFTSFINEAALTEIGIQVNQPKVFVGLLIGGAVPFLFTAFSLKAVGRAAYYVVEEVRRQFREHPGIMTRQETPEYSRCVDIVTAAAQKELLGPGLVAVATPVLVAFGLGAAACGGYLCGAILTGQLLAVYMANTGGLWDNAKKKIEDGFLGGKGTDRHKAAVIGDTVGDPYKDTAGPSLNPLIKVMNLVAILIVPFTIHPLSTGLRALIVGISLTALIVAVVVSHRGAILLPTTSDGELSDNTKG
jgi:K(+)-stimulated pyrophosphate-energized sodium pump